ncbi:TonB-dependent receptor [Corallococcus macrosporus]|uniref:TonB-dependent receptor n=1 Tax=Corallococcus macrosporus TaxID=35 RepID=A0ABS3DH67_9BACT|nr:TonB-dependent receptor [Corallococcus macrosporus]MBN8230664.1 TonB-dependent receptor [Corallococcus macrosporus]
MTFAKRSTPWHTAALALALCLLWPLLPARAQAPSPAPEDDPGSVRLGDTLDAGLPVTEENLTTGSAPRGMDAPWTESLDGQDGGTGTVAKEADLQRTDAGWAVESGAPAADGGPALAAFVPPALVQDSPAPYPPLLVGEGVTGTVKLELLVDEAGEVDTATLVEGVHPLLNEAALHAAPSLRFSPAMMEGQPVAVRLFFEYRFEAPVPVASGADGGTLAPQGPITLKGLVRQKGNRRPLIGATLVSDAAPDSPVQTDENGRFEARFPTGGQAVRVFAPGHKPGLFREALKATESLEVVYGLEPLVVNPYETVVRGDRERTEVSRVTLHDAELREVPGTMGDPFRVVMLLPGVGSMLSGVAYPVVRGSQPASTGYFLDGIRIPILFHLFLGPAVIHPDFLDAIDFYPGSPPPQYGRLMGGAIDGRLTRPRDDRVHGSAYADFINAGFFLETPFKSTGTNVSLAGRYSYTPWIIALAANQLQDPPPPGRTNPKVVLDFWDYQARVEQDVGQGKLRLFAFGSSDTFGSQAQDDQGDTALQSIAFHRVDLRGRHPLGKGELEVGGTWGTDDFAVVSRGPDNGNEINIDQSTFSGRVGYSVPLDERLLLRAGADVDHKRAIVDVLTIENGQEVEEDTVRVPVALATFTGAYAEGVWTPNDRWTVVPGLRLDSYHLSGGFDHKVIEPRLTVRHKLTDTVTLKGGAGIFHQPPTTLISLPVVDVGSLLLGLQEGVQLSTGVEWKAFDKWEVGLDVYVNPMLRTIELTPFSDEGLTDDLDGGGDPDEPPPPPGGDVGPNGFRRVRARQVDIDEPPVSRDDWDLPDFSSHGLAYGLELLIRYPLGNNWFGWLSYSLQRSTRRTTFYRYDSSGQAISEDSADLPFAFDQTHILNLVVSHKFSNNITLGGVLHFNTGRPEYGTLGSQTHREGTDSDGRPTWVQVDRDAVDRLPPFFRFDLRVSKAWAYDTFSLEAYLDMLNVTLNTETLGFDYLGGGYSRQPLTKSAVGLPIALPIIGVKGRY